MAAKILDGKQIAAAMKQELHAEVGRLSSPPHLRVLYFTPGGSMGGASMLYWLAQQKAARELEILIDGEGRSADVQPEDVERIIERWNRDPRVHGIFIHQPMPPRIDPQRISAVIDPAKDVEGIHPQNSARRFFARARIGSCTALAVMRLIEETGVDLAGKEAVVIGHSEIVGRPVSMLLLDRLATTTVCHIGTHQAKRLKEHVGRAEVLVVAVGKPNFIEGDWIREGAIVIDVGINVEGGKVIGDVEFETAKARAGYITPVPGGVGPVTVMMVMKNTVEAFKLQHGPA